MSEFVVRPLDAVTWPDFARLVEKHNGVWGGCWCMEFHAEGAERSGMRRDWKQARVRDGRGHAALVYDAPECIGWCPFGATDELRRIKRQRAYAAAATEPSDWRIPCFFVDKDCRRRGVAAAALKGALREIARSGGGAVESYPEAIDGRSAGFLHNATLDLFQQHGFERQRPVGKHHWVVSTLVPASEERAPA